MKKILTLLFAMTLTILFMVSCSLDSSGGISINPLADDMRKCAPDLASSGNDMAWDPGWKTVVLNKHFNSSSKGDSIYSPVELFDDKLAYFSGLLSSSSSTPVTGSITLPAIFGGTEVSGFETRVEVDQYIFYYKPAGTDGTEKFLFYWNQDPGIQSSLYAIRDNTSNDLEIWTAGFNTVSENTSHGIMHFEGNTGAQNFKFRIKTDAGSSGAGWAFWGGGSIATEDSYIAVRGANIADSGINANDGGGITDDDEGTKYVILTFGQMKDADYNGGGYPEVPSNLTEETDDAALVVKYIAFGDDCLHADVGAAQNFRYPTAANQLAIQ